MILAHLCSAYPRNVRRNEVVEAYQQRCTPRTKAALAAKWAAIKKKRLTARQRSTSSGAPQWSEGEEEAVRADDPSAEGIEYPKGEHGEGFDDPNDLGIVPSPVTEAGERDISTETESVPSNGRLPATFRKAFLG